jgi:hypothetical protein
VPLLISKKRVKIVDGPLLGLNGTLVRTTKSDRAVISIRSQRCRLLVELDSDMIKREPEKETAKGAQQD